MSQHQKNNSGRRNKHLSIKALKDQMKAQKMGKYADARTVNQRVSIMNQIVVSKKRSRATSELIGGVQHNGE